MRVVPAFFVASVSISGCRCDRSPPEPQATAPSATSRGPERCPPPPSWASPIEDESHLVVELLYQPAAAAGRNGTGVRIYDDGRTIAYDEIKATIVDGKIKSERIPGAWRQSGIAAKSRVDEITTLVTASAREELEGMQGDKNKPTHQRPTLVFARKNGALLASCWLGQEGSSAQRRLEEVVRRALAEVNDAAAEKKLPAHAAGGGIDGTCTALAGCITSAVRIHGLRM